LLYKRIVSLFSRVQLILYTFTDLYIINCTLENGLTIRNKSSFYNKFFFNFFGTLPSDPPNFIKLSEDYSFNAIFRDLPNAQISAKKVQLSYNEGIS
jgi:hypothetical protein